MSVGKRGEEKVHVVGCVRGYKHEGECVYATDVERIIVAKNTLFQRLEAAHTENERLKARVAELDQLRTELDEWQTTAQKASDTFGGARFPKVSHKHLLAVTGHAAKTIGQLQARLAELEARSEYVAKAVELMDAYRETELNQAASFDDVDVAIRRLLRHAYNEGKTP